MSRDYDIIKEMNAIIDLMEVKHKQVVQNQYCIESHDRDITTLNRSIAVSRSEIDKLKEELEECKRVLLGITSVQS